MPTRAGAVGVGSSFSLGTTFPTSTDDIRLGQAVLVILIQDPIFVLYVYRLLGSVGCWWQGGHHTWSAFSKVLPVFQMSALSQFPHPYL